MGYKCGNTGKEFQTRQEWIRHLVREMKSPVYEGEARDIELSKKELNKLVKEDPSNDWASKALERYD